MIHLLWCTIRTQNFPQIHNYWMGKVSDKNSFKTHVLVSTQPETDYLKSYFDSINHPNRIVVFQPPHPGVCLPSYKLSSSLDFFDDDIIVFGSDDFTPPQNWDLYLKEKFGDRDGLLMVRDGYQLPDSSNMLHPAITIPIMNGIALRKLNCIIYHPAYHHMFSDCELYDVAEGLGILIDNRLTDTTVFEHHHYAAGKRHPDGFDQSYHGKWKDDEATWNKRKMMTVEEKLVV